MGLITERRELPRGRSGGFDGDGKADLIWRKVNTGETVVWSMNGLALRQAAYVTTVSDLNWSIVAPR